MCIDWIFWHHCHHCNFNLHMANTSMQNGAWLGPWDAAHYCIPGFQLDFVADAARRRRQHTRYQWACQIVLSINLDCQCKENLEKSIQWPFQTCRINSSTPGGRMKTKSSWLYPWSSLPGICWKWAALKHSWCSGPVFRICNVPPLSSTWICVPLRTLSLDFM